MHGLDVLDLFAGTGALALEAISRGAESAVLVDSGRQAVSLCQQNALNLGFSDKIEMMAVPVSKALGTLGAQGRQFDLIFVDAPYAATVSTETLQALVQNALLQSNARVVVEHDKREILADSISGLQRTDERRFGDTVVSLYSLS